ncbi:MAG: hypothetical protein HY319_20825 [Armatimonadetes bacterium]|nr:hypothetical protein [Armatimonadota bacterium]
MESLNLLFPEQRYDCIRCGKSCRGGWRVLLDSEAEPRIRKARATRRLEDRGFSPLTCGPDGLWRLQESPACLYLTEEALCSLHLELGSGGKPRACRQFPFFLTETPDGIQVGLSFRCAAVQRDLGRPLSGHRSELEELVATGNYPRRGFGPIALGSDRSLDWREYLELEKALLNSLEELGPGDGLRVVLSSLLPANQADLPIQFFLQWAVGTLVAQLEADDPGKVEDLARRLQAGAPFSSRRFAEPVSPLPSPRLDWLEAEIVRYVRHLVVRKFLLEPPSVLGRLVGLLLLPAALRFYTGIFARAAGRKEPAPEDLHRAWDVIEGEVAGHVQGTEGYFQSLEAGILAAVG